MKKILIALLALPLLIGCNTPKEETDLKIITQPVAEQNIAFPDGFTLSVDVNNEKLVKSYQWQIDNGTEDHPSWKDLDCTSGRSKTLTKMSTTPVTKNKRYRCVIQDQNDNLIYSDDAWVNMTNSHTYKDAISIAGYSIQAGETFDLSKTNLGTGTIEYDENGYEVTLHNVCFENSNPVYAYYDSTMGFNATIYDDPNSTFIINVDGINHFSNNFWQEDENAGGIIFSFNFLGDSQVENVIFQGEGSLSLEGGTNLIYANTKVEIACDMVLNKIGNRYTTGIYALEIEIKENVNIQANLNGFLFQTKQNGEGEGGALKIDSGTTISCVATVPHVSVGATDFHLVSAMTTLTMEGCNFNYIINCDKNVFDSKQSVGQVVGFQVHFGDMNIKNCQISGRLVTNNPDNTIFYYQKFLLAEEGNITVENSKLESTCDDSKMMHAAGIYARKNVSVLNSSIDLTIKASGNIEGITSNGVVSLDSSSLSIHYDSYTKDAISRGLICCGLTLNNNSTATFDSTGGIALLIQVGAGDEKKDYDPSYVPSVLNQMVVVSPSTYVINQYSLTGSSHNYVYMETLYADGSTTTPSSSCTLKSL